MSSGAVIEAELLVDRERLMELYRAARATRDPAAALGHLQAVIAASAEEPGLLLDEAETLLDLGRAEESERASLRALAMEPGSRRAHVALVRAARINADLEGLRDRLATAITALPTDPELLAERGELLLATDDARRAEIDFRSALAVAPNDRRALLGMFHAGRGRVEPAETLARIEAVIALCGPEPSLVLDRADALVALGHIEPAEAAFRAALALAPKDRRARLGLFHVGRGRVSPAEELARVEAAIAVSGPDVSLQLDRAEALIRAGSAEAAEAAAVEVLATRPVDTRALLIMVQAARVRRDAELLLARADAALVIAPDDPEFAWDRATALVELGRAGEAEAMLQRLAATAGEDPELHLRLGRLARATGDRRGALSSFRHALALAPGQRDTVVDCCTELTALADYDEARALADTLGASLDAHLCRGFVARESGDRASALRSFRAAMEVAPDHHGAALNASAELAELGMVDEAEHLARDVLTRAAGDTPTTVQAVLRLAHVAQLRPDRPGALRHLLEAVELAPRNPDVIAQLAAELREQGQFDAAETTLGQLETLRPRALETFLARGHLARRRGFRAQALEIYGAAHQAFPDAAAPLAEMAIEQRALNRLAEAEASLRAALMREPRHVDANMRLAETHLMAERHDDCIALCIELRDRLPHLVPAWIIQSRAVADRDGSAAAFALLDESVAAIGFHPELMARRIDLLRDAGDYPAIRSLIRTDAVGETRHPGLWASVVRAMLRFAEIGEIEAMLARAPTGAVGITAEAEELRGALAEARWSFVPALEHYRRVLAIDPNRHSIEQDVARVCLVELDVDGAHTALRNYVERCAGDRSLRGESIKASQTHVGQLLDEYRLDDETVSELAVLRASRAPGDRIGPTREIMARNPNSTSASASLLVSLREAGQFEPARLVEGAAPAIPRRITQFWSQPVPASDVEWLMRSWASHHPEHVYTRYDDIAAQEWIRQHHLPRVLMAFRRARQLAQKADLFRLAVLGVEGGLYADADDRCLGPFDDLLGGGATFVAYQEDYGTLGNNVIACAPGHPVVRRALGLAVAAINRGDNDLLWLSTGPGLLSRAFALTVAGEAQSGEAVLARSRILDRRTLGRVMAMHCQVTYKSTEAHWLQNLMK